MAKLPSLTARKVVRALKRAGFAEDRQKGSHLILTHPETKARTVVPVHPGRTIKEPLLRAIVRLYAHLASYVQLGESNR